MKTGQEYYKELVKQHGPNEKALGFSHPASQIASFLQFDKWMVSEKFFDRPLTVLDIGCGVCDLFQMFVELGYPIEHYTGVDTNRDILKAGVDKVGRFKDNLPNFKGAEFDTSLSKFKQRRFDVVVCLNVFSYWEGTAEELEQEYANLVETMSKMAGLGFAINCISPFADYFEWFNKPLSVEQAVGICKV